MAVVSTGFFDGVHLGHRAVLDRLLSEAQTRGEESVVVTFWPHPRNVLQNGARSLRLLTSLQEKTDLIKACGVDQVAVLPFTREFSRLRAEEYLREILVPRFRATSVILGYDNRLGCDLLGPEDLLPVVRNLGMTLGRVEGVPVPGSADPSLKVSSTRIRTLLEEGSVSPAARMLGTPYSLHGVVVAGNRLGRQIGFPTANMQLYEPLKLIPANGVY